MSTGASALAMMAVFSGLSMNLILQFGLGLRELAIVDNPGYTKTAGKHELIKGLWILFITILLLWLLFSLYHYSYQPAHWYQYAM